MAAGIKWQPLAESTVTTAGTEVQITATSTLTSGIQIQAAEGNSGLVYVGLSDVANNKYIVALGAGEVWSTANSDDSRGREFDLSDYWLDSSANAHKAYVSYLKSRN